MFNIFLNDFYLSVTNSHLSNKVDNNTLHCYGKTTNAVNKKLKLGFRSVTTCFHEKSMLVNPGKCHYICLGSKTGKADFSFERKIFEKSKEEIILSVVIYNKITSYNPIKGLSKKASHKILPNRTRSLVFIDLHSETKGSWFESG